MSAPCRHLYLTPTCNCSDNPFSHSFDISSKNPDAIATSIMPGTFTTIGTCSGYDRIYTHLTTRTWVPQGFPVRVLQQNLLELATPGFSSASRDWSQEVPPSGRRALVGRYITQYRRISTGIAIYSALNGSPSCIARSLGVQTSYSGSRLSSSHVLSVVVKPPFGRSALVCRHITPYSDAGPKIGSIERPLLGFWPTLRQTAVQ